MTPPKPPLTKEQAAWAVQYLPLARSLARKHKFDDQTVFYEVICKAARSYDLSKKISFQALLTRSCANAAIDIWRKGPDRLVVGVKPELLDVAKIAVPVNDWTPPEELPERKIRAPGMGKRSLQMRAKEQGYARPRGRPRVLDDATVLKLLLVGRTSAEVMRALGVSRETIRTICANNRKLIKQRGSSKKDVDKRMTKADANKVHPVITLTREQIAAARALRAAGMSWRKVAVEMQLRHKVKASYWFWFMNVPRGEGDRRKRRAK
jgi:DNA-directed RNA polymerase specialized sigma24 family protein